MNLTKLSITLLFVLSCHASCGELVKNSEITRIGTSSDGVSDNFFITVSGGSGPCANQTIIFQASASPSEGFFNRLYSTALLAYSTGAKNVRVYSPSSDSCGSATYIDIIKD